MFDNLREQANSSPFNQEEAQFQPAASTIAAPPRRSSPRLLGMTGPQRFLLSLMLLAAVCLLGTMCLLLSGKIGL